MEVAHNGVIVDPCDTKNSHFGFLLMDSFSVTMLKVDRSLRYRFVRCGWPIRVFRLNGHSRQFFSQQLIFVSIYKAGIPSRIARSLQIKNARPLVSKPEVGLILDTPYIWVLLFCVHCLHCHSIRQEVMSICLLIRSSFLLFLNQWQHLCYRILDGKDLEHLQKKKD